MSVTLLALLLPPCAPTAQADATVTDDALLLTVQAATLRNRVLVVPENTTDVILEIGCSDRNTADDEVLPTSKHSFLLAFEPLLDKYALLLAKGTHRYHGGAKDRAVPLGHHHQRGVILPLAVSQHGGPLTFHVNEIAGCSGLKAVALENHFACKHALETRHVPSISLEAALGLVPSHLPISLLKIDAEGVDFNVLATTPATVLRRVRHLHFEFHIGDADSSGLCPGLYAGLPRCEEILAHMSLVGFIVTSFSSVSTGPIRPTNNSTLTCNHLLTPFRRDRHGSPVCGYDVDMSHNKYLN